MRLDVHLPQWMQLCLWQSEEVVFAPEAHETQKALCRCSRSAEQFPAFLQHVYLSLLGNPMINPPLRSSRAFTHFTPDAKYAEALCEP